MYGPGAICFSAEVKTDPWSMSPLEASLGEQPKRNKTPQEFLGANSNLVNLDELVKPDQTSKRGEWNIFHWKSIVWQTV